MFVKPGFARAADPTNMDSLVAALEWFVNHPDQRQAMAARAQAKIEKDWNYDTVFAPILGVLSDV